MLEIVLKMTILPALLNTVWKKMPQTKNKNKRWKKNMAQMKEQGKNLQDQINEEEIGKLPEKEFSVMIVNMIQNLRNRGTD